MVTADGEYEVPVDDGDVDGVGNVLGSFPVPREVRGGKQSLHE